jgi:hypothetical protein
MYNPAKLAVLALLGLSASALALPVADVADAAYDPIRGAIRGGERLTHDAVRGGERFAHGAVRGGERLAHDAARGGERLAHDARKGLGHLFPRSENEAADGPFRGAVRGGERFAHDAVRGGERLAHDAFRGGERLAHDARKGFGHLFPRSENDAAVEADRFPRLDLPSK